MVSKQPATFSILRYYTWFQFKVYWLNDGGVFIRDGAFNRDNMAFIRFYTHFRD